MSKKTINHLSEIKTQFIEPKKSWSVKSFEEHTKKISLVLSCNFKSFFFTFN